MSRRAVGHVGSLGAEPVARRASTSSVAARLRELLQFGVGPRGTRTLLVLAALLGIAGLVVRLGGLPALGFVLGGVTVAIAESLRERGYPWPALEAFGAVLGMVGFAALIAPLEAEALRPLLAIPIAGPSGVGLQGGEA